MFHFQFGNGIPMPGVRPARPAPTELYERLGVSSKATKREIQESFRKLALKHHPDKGGDPEEFKKIREAFEILSDDEKRQHYDTPQGFPGDIFSELFAGAGMRGMRMHRRGPDKQEAVHVNLAQLYKRERTTLNIQRRLKDGTKQTKTIQMTFPATIHNGAQICVEHMGDESENWDIPGHVYVRVHVEDSFQVGGNTWQRKKENSLDISTEIVVPLAEILTQFERHILLPDGTTTIHICSNKNMIYKDGHIFHFANKGLPSHGSAYVVLRIQMPDPDNISWETREEIARLLRTHTHLN